MLSFSPFIKMKCQWITTIIKCSLCGSTLQTAVKYLHGFSCEANRLTEFCSSAFFEAHRRFCSFGIRLNRVLLCEEGRSWKFASPHSLDLIHILNPQSLSRIIREVNDVIKRSREEYRAVMPLYVSVSIDQSGPFHIPPFSLSERFPQMEKPTNNILLQRWLNDESSCRENEWFKWTQIEAFRCCCSHRSGARGLRG